MISTAAGAPLVEVDPSGRGLASAALVAFGQSTPTQTIMAERQLLSAPVSQFVPRINSQHPSLLVGSLRNPAKAPISGRGKPILFEYSKQSFRRFFRTLHVHNGTELADVDSQAMKQSTTSSNPDQNWHWPEKTWFRERLNAIKAREQETRQKITPTDAMTEPVASSAKGDPKND